MLRRDDDKNRRKITKKLGKPFTGLKLFDVY